MTWNHRLVQHHEFYFGMHEVYYDDKGEAWAMSPTPTTTGESREEVIDTLEKMLKNAKEKEVFIPPASWKK